MSQDDEATRIAALTRHLAAGEGVVLGPGDDAAVLRPSERHDLVVTTDAFVEGQHFRREQLSLEAIGRRLAAANLSDLAAMGALPRWVVFSLMVPDSWSEPDVRGVQHAAAVAFEGEAVSVVGGNLARTDGPLVLSVTLLGEVERGRQWMRSGARVGDVLAVTGTPGLAGLALAAAARGAAWPSAYLSPPSRVRVARALAAAGGVKAAIDLSDGLPGDLAQLLRASGIGAELEAASLPPGALEPSDDYELLLAIDPARIAALEVVARTAGAPLSVIGRCVADGLVVRGADGAFHALPPRGYDHFA
ncbi:MAG: thiamine-phosphate kinase [Candidatus Eisenbacteria bacterium]